MIGELLAAVVDGLLTVPLLYVLRKPRKIYAQIERLYRRKEKMLTPQAREEVGLVLMRLKEALVEKNASEAKRLSAELKKLSLQFMPKSPFERVRDFVVSIGVALLFAVVIRTMWFELYTIPTGSMRPTLKESDVLLVSKTDFGLNIPLKSSHFTFDPTLVQRGSIVVWSTGDMDIPDSDTRYFGVFPGKKIFVKRLIGKPGDTLYFYGGQIYGVDCDGNEIKDSAALEHIPFIHFDGKVDTSSQRGGSSSTFRQMDLPIAKLSTNSFGFISGEMIGQNGREPLAHYSDLWGMKNYAMARLLTKKDLHAMHPSLEKGLTPGVLYLELTHHPSLKEARALRDEMGRIRPDLGLSASVIPLDKEHVDLIASNMTTARFNVKNGSAYRLGFEEKHPFYSKHYPTLEGVPNGTYEIQNGKAFEVFSFGFTKELSHDHPLYSKDPAFVQSLYNLGIEFLDQYKPEKNSKIYPSRYAYFRDGALYLLGSPIFQKGESALADFAKSESMRKLISSSTHPYLPFEDNGPPISADFIRKYGVVIPEKSYLMLGDNHAMSADSRQFGFVPEENLKGSVSFLLSPFGERWGRPLQPAMDYFGFPNLFVWTSATLLTMAYTFVRKRKEKQPIQL